MKTIILSLFLSVMSFMGFAQAYQVTVSGTVIESISGMPLGGLSVTIETDSTPSGGYYNVVLTDINGYYTDTFNAADGEQGMVITSIDDCDGEAIREINQYSYNVNVFEVNFTYCEDSTGGDTSCMAMYSYYNGDNYLEISFEDESFGNPTSWSWDFGDGTTSTEQNPVHSFAQEGDYQVCLTITDTVNDCESTYCEEIVVEEWNDCQAFYYYMPIDSTGNGTGTYQFTDFSMGNPDSWSWSYGDIIFSNEQNPVYTFDHEGVYNVCLTIYNSVDSCQDTYCENIYVYYDSLNCFGYFEYGVTDSSGLTLDFAAVDYGSDSMDYTWNFGDGNTGTGEAVSHTYADGGVYEVVLTANSADSGGCSWSYDEAVWVGDNWTFNISGIVYVDSLVPADAGSAYLMAFDTTWTNLINIDTAVINADGSYEFEVEPFEHCLYFVQAELSDQSAYFGQYVPTYYVNALSWEEAWPVFPFVPEEYYIFMIPQTTSNSGHAAIAGVVNAQGSRGVVEGVMMLLMDESGNPIGYVRTSEDGAFDFSELAYGTYQLRIEYVGIESQTATITLSEGNPTSNVIVTLKNGEAYLGVDEIHSAYLKEFGNIYPNPVTSDASVNITMKQASKVNVIITNQMGQVIVANTVNLQPGANKVDLHTTHLPQGVYIIKVQSKDGALATRKMVKVN